MAKSELNALQKMLRGLQTLGDYQDVWISAENHEILVSISGSVEAVDYDRLTDLGWEYLPGPTYWRCVL